MNQLDNLRKQFTAVKIGAFYKVSIIAVKRWEITLIIEVKNVSGEQPHLLLAFHRQHWQLKAAQRGLIISKAR